MTKPEKGQMSQRDKVIELMFDALPATTMREIAAKIRRRMPEAHDRSVHQALEHLRKNTEKYGWTVPHVGGDSTKKDRYFALLVERDGTYHFDDSPESRGHLRDGSKSMVMRIATESNNQSTMLLIAAKHERKQTRRLELRNLGLDCEYVARKALALAQSMGGDDDNGGGGGRKAA
jgi:hypothetical protein